MKVHIALLLSSALLHTACGQITSEDIQEVKDAFSAMTSEDQAANEIYLDDVVDSSAEDSASTSDDTASEETKEDIRAERLAQMASMLIKRLDADADGSLSLEEFLIGPAKRAEESEAIAEKIAKIKAKMTEDFNTFAGEDKILSSTELQELLKSAAPRIGELRRVKYPGKQEERVQKSASDLIKEFDKDADGKLDAAELEALQAARKSAMDEFRKDCGFGGERGAGEGRGSRGKGKKGGEEKPEDDGDEI